MSALDEISIRWKPGLRIEIDPDDEVLYTWHWTARLPKGVTIASYEFVVEGHGVIKEDAMNEAKTSVMCILAEVPARGSANVTCRVVTTSIPPERLDRSVLFVGRQL
jgi:hypothetical protein